jgi:hypothetical protein
MSADGAMKNSWGARAKHIASLLNCQRKGSAVVSLLRLTLCAQLCQNEDRQSRSSLAKFTGKCHPD